MKAGTFQCLLRLSTKSEALTSDFVDSLGLSMNMDNLFLYV